MEQGLVQSFECLKHMNSGSGSSALSIWARGLVKCTKRTNSGTGSSELSGREQKDKKKVESVGM